MADFVNGRAAVANLPAGAKASGFNPPAKLRRGSAGVAELRLPNHAVLHIRRKMG
jgi:hypothetical protein